MAITKIDAPNSIPSAVADYQLQNAHMMGFINQTNAQAFILTDPQGLTKPSIAQGSYLNHGGSLYLVDSADEAISGSPSNGSVYVKLSGGATLTAEFITNISGYAYNPATGNIESGSNFILPYMIVKSGSEWRKYRWEISNGLRVGALEVNGAVKAGTITSGAITSSGAINASTVTASGAIKGATIDTGQGAVEAYAMNQAVRTTDNVTFNKITNSQGLIKFSFERQTTPVNIAPMVVGEIRFVAYNNPNSGQYIKTPVTGRFSYTAGSFSYGNDVAGNTNMVSMPSTIVIMRIS